MDIEADLPNPNGDISAGTYVTINWVIEVRTNILVIPTDAIVRGISPKVLRLGLNGVVEERAIKIGMQTSDSAEVLSGLAEGDLVAVGRLGSLRQGQQVDTSKPDSSAPPKKDVR
jgi:multidrug efflux pump subunit AcrA (membrane-fusion protein)